MTTSSPLDLIGQQFGRLTVSSRAFPNRPGRWWNCDCECGGHSVRSTSQLRDRPDRVKSCGCARAESIQRATKAAKIANTKWCGPYRQQLRVLLGNMKRRCFNPKDTHFHLYGGRGIKICQTWLSDSASFFDWAVQNGYEPGLSIDRINVNGDYCPENCRFIPMGEQASNTRRNRFLTYHGITRTVAQWARSLGVNGKALQHRVDRGWDVERIFTQPFRGRRGR